MPPSHDERRETPAAYNTDDGRAEDRRDMERASGEA
jgi:hypothetical protein